MKFLDILKSSWLQIVIKTLVEKVPVLSKLLKLIDGKKTTIGRILMFLAALIGTIQAEAPELLANAYVEQSVIYLTAFIGWALTELGLQHKTLKDLETEGVVSEETM